MSASKRYGTVRQFAGRAVIELVASDPVSCIVINNFSGLVVEFA